MSNKIEKLTWQEIVERYPNQWVGMCDIEWMEDDPTCGEIRSAVVKYSDLSADELTWKQLIEKEGIFSRYTSIDTEPEVNLFD